VTVYNLRSHGYRGSMALKSLILRVVADDKLRSESKRPKHPWATVRSRRSRDVERRLTAANNDDRR
jgi:hypothetical protein